MGTSIFGVDIAGIIRDATKDQFLPLTLIKQTPTTRDPTNLAGGLRSTTTSYTGEGFIEDDNLINAGTGFRPDDNIVRAERIVNIVGDSLPLVNGVRIAPMGTPTGTHNDKVTIDGRTYTIIRVKTDPAKAMYRCQVRA